MCIARERDLFQGIGSHGGRGLVRPEPGGAANRPEIQTKDDPSSPKAIAVEPEKANIADEVQRPSAGKFLFCPIPAFD